MFALTTRAVSRSALPGVPRAASRPLVLRPAPLSQRSFILSGWASKKSTDPAETSADAATKKAAPATTKKTASATTKKTRVSDSAKKAKEQAKEKALKIKAKEQAKEKALKIKARAKEKALKEAEKKKNDKKKEKEKAKEKLNANKLKEKEEKIAKRKQGPILQLKEWALLDEPPKLPTTTWAIYVSQNYPKQVGANTTAPAILREELAPAYRALSESALKDLRLTATANAKANDEAYKAWLEKYPPELILAAQAARRRIIYLNAKSPDSVKVKISRPKLEDERLPGALIGPYARFIKHAYSQTGEGPMDRAAVKSRMRDMAARWNAMSDAEKRPFVEAAEAQKKDAHPRRAELSEKAVAYWTKHSTVTPNSALSLLKSIL